jgi:hypothetical protein
MKKSATYADVARLRLVAETLAGSPEAGMAMV